MSVNSNYQLLLESAQWKEKMGKEESITVNQTKFFALMKQRKDEIRKFEKLDKFNNGLVFSIYPQEVQREKTDEVFRKKTENWKKMLSKDVYLEEAVNIISEMI